jgi:hypothetical protein
MDATSASAEGQWRSRPRRWTLQAAVVRCASAQPPSRLGREQGLLAIGDRVVFLTGTNFYPLAHNVLVVHEV